MSLTYHKMGPLNFEVRGETEVCAAVRRELKATLSAPSEPHIIFDFSAPISISNDYIISNHMKVSPGIYEATNSMLRHTVTSKFGVPILVNIVPDLKGMNSIIMALRDIRALNWNYLSLNETIAKNFIYGIFDYLTQIKLLEHDATYIHASAIEKNGKALLLTGRGGVGKSSFMLKSILESKYRYLSDDLAIIDASSTVWRTPKKMQLYGYNITNEPVIRDALLRNRSYLDLATWHARSIFKNGKRVRRRVSAEHLFGNARLAEHAVVETAVFLERHTSNDVRIDEINLADFSYRCATVLIEELNPFSSISLSEHSASDKPILPSILNLHSSSLHLMERALSTAKLIHIRVPEDFSPTKLSSELERFLP